MRHAARLRRLMTVLFVAGLVLAPMAALLAPPGTDSRTSRDRASAASAEDLAITRSSEGAAIITPHRPERLSTKAPTRNRSMPLASMPEARWVTALGAAAIALMVGGLGAPGRIDVVSASVRGPPGAPPRP